ncbi:MAG: zinc-ribbon domain-containing protein [Actinomycetes bacterium]
MLIILGLKRYVELLGMTVLVCPFCGQRAAQRVEQWTTKLTVFFLPLLPVRRRQVMQCASCGAQSELSRAEAEQVLAGTMSRDAG